MRRELSKAEVERLFTGAIDEALPASERARLDEALAQDQALSGQFSSYQRVVQLLREQPREKAPDALASMILRRTRRRRFSLQTQRLTEAHRFPAEIIIPLVLAAVVAVLIMMAH